MEDVRASPGRPLNPAYRGAAENLDIDLAGQPAASALRRPRKAQNENPTASSKAAPKAAATSVGVPARKPRPDSSTRVNGLTTATPWIQPWSSAASSSRRAKPLSKSRAIPNPVKTPPKAADCSSTKTNWKAV